MISLSLQSVADDLQATLLGDDLIFKGCNTDTRSLKKGELFVALHGPSFDGHDYIEMAEKAGAAGVMIDKAVTTDLPTLQVENTREALGNLAALWREEFDIPVVAITGSNGKTTVKEMLSSILSRCGNVLSTKGNLNNDIGVPQTLFNLDQEHDFAVIEMGANHLQEIARLCEMAKPLVAVVTQCAPAHLEGFGSIEGVAKAKGEIFESLGNDGIAVINADDKFASFWKKLAGDSQIISFGLNDQVNDDHADVTASIISMRATVSHFKLRISDEEIDVKLSLPGRHNIMNALAATACAKALDISSENIRDGLEALQNVPGRLQFKIGMQNLQIIDDTYNANPGSFSAAMDVLINTSGQHWLALGDMGELGSAAVKMHKQAGELARLAGVERLFTIGELSKKAAEKFGDGAEHFADHAELIERIKIIKNESDKDITLLIKGSRSAEMETVVQALESGYVTDTC